MVNKCWKKSSESKGDVEYTSKHGAKLFVTKEINQYLVESPGFIISPEEGLLRGVFKKKSDALKLANKYMKKNNKC